MSETEYSVRNNIFGNWLTGVKYKHITMERSQNRGASYCVFMRDYVANNLVFIWNNTKWWIMHNVIKNVPWKMGRWVYIYMLKAHAATQQKNVKVLDRGGFVLTSCIHPCWNMCLFMTECHTLSEKQIIKRVAFPLSCAFLLQLVLGIRWVGRLVWGWRGWPWFCLVSLISGFSGARMNASSSSSTCLTSISPSPSR